MLDAANLRAKALRNAVDVLVDILSTDHPGGFHRRGIEKGIGDIGRGIRDMVLSADDVLGTHDITDVVKLGIELELIEAFDDPNDSGKRRMVLIRASNGTPSDGQLNHFSVDIGEVSQSVPTEVGPN